MKWAKRNLPAIFGGEAASAERGLAKLNAACTSTMESEQEIMEGFSSLIESAKKTRKALENSELEDVAPPTLGYWKDEAGEHSFVTDKVLVP